jgi:hypothetical protein
MERNEVQGICIAYDPVARGTLFETGQLNVLLQAALDPDPRLGNVPYLWASIHPRGSMRRE